MLNRKKKKKNGAIEQKNDNARECLDSPVARTWHFHYSEPRFNPWSEN